MNDIFRNAKQIAVAGLLGIPLEAQIAAMELARTLRASVSVGGICPLPAPIFANATASALTAANCPLVSVNAPVLPDYLSQAPALALALDEGGCLALFDALRALARGISCSENDPAAALWALLQTHGALAVAYGLSHDAVVNAALEQAARELSRKYDILLYPVLPEDGRYGAWHAVLEHAAVPPPARFDGDGAQAGEGWALSALLEQRAVDLIVHIGAPLPGEDLPEAARQAGAKLVALVPEACAPAFRDADLLLAYPDQGGYGTRLRSDGTPVPWEDAPDILPALDRLLGEVMG